MSEELPESIAPLPGMPEPGSPEYETWYESAKEQPPFLMPDGPYERSGSQNWLKAASKVVKTPKTEMLEVKYTLEPLLDGKEPLGFNELVDDLDKAALAVGGYPVFFRSGQTSAKHFGLDACVAKDRDDFMRVIPLLMERSCMGFPEQSCRYLLVREMIPTEPVFDAYMPITREFRLFVENGEISHIQPYWPEEAMIGYSGEPDDPAWREKLRSISLLTQKEREFLEAETLKIAQACPGDWSVDWLQDMKGEWWMTDMAAACVSYRWDPDFEIERNEADDECTSPGM